MHEPEPTLTDVVPALLTALGVPGFPSRLAVPEADAACVLLIDGLGWELLAEHAAHAPVLAAAATAGRSIVAGFPATTATSIASLTTGVSAGRHGIVGASFAIPDVLPDPGPALNALRWQTFGTPDADSPDTVDPRRVQPEPTTLERAAAAGVHVWQVAPDQYRDSGLNGAVLRGGTFRGVCLPSAISRPASSTHWAAHARRSATPTTVTWTCSGTATARVRPSGATNYGRSICWSATSSRPCRRVPCSPWSQITGWSD